VDNETDSPGITKRLSLVARSFAYGILTRFGLGFWKFFAAAFFFDLGIGLYFFLFNLYLADLHFNERAIGLISGSLTLGNVLGTLPAMMIARRSGLRHLLLFCFTATPLVCVFRTLLLWPSAQIALAFLAGVALCSWPICFSPMVASLTDENNRVSGFSVTFATGIGLGALAGLTGGYLPGILQKAFHAGSVAGSLRIVLLLACGTILLGIVPLLRLQVKASPRSENPRIRVFHPLLLWFLPPFVVWSIVTGSFPPFAAIYLQQHLGMPLRYVGVAFSASQVAQVAAVLLAPLLYRRIGSVLGIACVQAATAISLFCMGTSHALSFSIACYLGYTGLQWMSNPGIYSFLMSRIPEDERTTASAFQNMSGALCQAVAAPLTGSCIVQFGYPPVFFGLGAIALLSAVLFVSLLGFSGRDIAKVTLHRALCVDPEP
jgi:MFS family permease